MSEQLPNATRMKVPSTSAAARAILACGADTDEPESAAICSVHCAESFDGLEILFRDIQNEASRHTTFVYHASRAHADDAAANTTRFYILSNSLDTPLPGSRKEFRRQRALVRVGNQLKESKEGDRLVLSTTTRMVTSTLLTAFGCLALRIDRRPSLNSVPFDDVYFIELGDLTLPASPSTEKLSENEWLQRIKLGIVGIVEAGGWATLLGVW